MKDGGGARGSTITRKSSCWRNLREKKSCKAKLEKKNSNRKKEVMQIFGLRKIHTQRTLPTHTPTKMKLSVPKWRILSYLLLQFFSKVISVEFSRTQQRSKAYFKCQASHVLNLRLMSFYKVFFTLAID